MGRLKLDGKTVPIGIFVLLFSVCATVLGWNLRSMAEEVSQNSNHRVAENATQAVAADILRETMREMDRPIVLHTHDEVCLEVEDAACSGAADALDRAMKAGTSWSTGLPMNCTIWTGKRYRK